MIEKNPKNAVYIKLCINEEDPKAKVKAAMIGVKVGSPIKTFKFFEHFLENFSKNNKFLGILRFLNYDEDLDFICHEFLNPIEAKAETCVPKKRKLYLPLISLANEKKMLQHLKEVATNALKLYPETYLEDNKLLENSALTYNERNCIIYRSGEKKVKNEINLVDIS